MVGSFEPGLREDVTTFATRRGFRVQRLSFDEPEDVSPLVADLYRWWYAQRGLPATRLLVDSFMMTKSKLVDAIGKANTSSTRKARGK
jgi:hypothetical protein